MKEFRQFLVEIDTIGHILKFRRRRERSEVTAISSVVETILLTHYPAYKTLPDDRHRLVNFLTEVIIQTVLFRAKRKLNSADHALSTFVNQEPRTRDAQIKRQVDKTMELLGDYVFGAPWVIVRSQLNDPRYIMDSPSSLMPDGDPRFERFAKASLAWHRQLAKSGGRGSTDFRVLIDLSSLGSKWKGYQWVSLDRSYCEQEKKAMGHCGNANFKQGDNILSLRDKKNRAYLTFIINDGVLGEMKGRGNDKPVRKYHPAIVQLLLHPDVKAIQGGGYKPMNNFKFSDLSIPDQQRIRSQKPILAEPPLIAMLMLNRMDRVSSILGLDSSMNPVFDSTTNQLILCKLPHTDHKSRTLPYDLVSHMSYDGSRYLAVNYKYVLSWLPFYPDKWDEKRFFRFVREPLPKQLSETEDIIEPRLRRIIYEKTDADDFDTAIQDPTVRKFLIRAYKLAVGSYVASSLREAVIKTFVPNSDRTAPSPDYYAGTDIWVNFTDNTLRTTVDSLRDLSVWLDTNETKATVAGYDMIAHIKGSGYFPWTEGRDVLDEYPDPKTYNKYLSKYLSLSSPDH